MEDVEIETDLSGEVVEEPKKLVNGTILEAAFVDPAYSWPPADGEGKNAVELQVMDDDSYSSGPSEKGVEFRSVTTTTSKRGLFNFKCCRSDDVVTTEQGKKLAPGKSAKQKKRSRKKSKGQASKQAPEGVLIYRLDTADRSIKLVSEPSSNTDVDTLLTSMVVAEAKPGSDKSRRAIDLVGVDGTKTTIVACDQRSAIAWLEAMDMMLGHKGRGDKVCAIVSL
jgi:hypothetical protein